MIEELIAQAKAHNKSIDDYINITLRSHFGSTKISFSQWFEAQRMINEQHFYRKAETIVDALRAEGVDAKINMQSDEIVLPWEYRD